MIALEKDQILGDSELERAIDRVLAREGKASKVLSVAKDGYVHLVGFVDNLETKKRIETLVEKLPGVKMITNHVRTFFRRELLPTSHF